MRDHWWWRPGWGPGRRFLTWHLTFDTIDGHADLHRVARAYQAQLMVPELDLVPLEGLHLTTQGIGFTDEVDPDALAEIVTAATSGCAGLLPFELTLGPARLEAEGVMLAVTPVEPLRELRMALRRAIAQVWGADRVPEAAEPFIPHVTVAYSNADGPAAPLIKRVERAGPNRALVLVDAVRLIELRRDTHVYRWTTRAMVRLGAAPKEILP